jgi:hypothetical protein
MTAAVLLQIIQGLLSAAPSLLSLYNQLKDGGTVTEAQVQAIFNQYGLDRVQLLADIAAEKAAGD